MLKISLKSAFFFILLVFFSLPVLFVSCTPDDLVTDPGNALSFSMDTVSFDTLFSNVGSTTVWLKVRNTGDKEIRISSIVLKSGGTSGFYINLDGESEHSFSNVDIPANDSLFLFVGVTTTKQGSDLPVKIQDEVLFNTDGPQKKIVLNVWSWDAEVWRNRVISKDTILQSGHPIVVFGTLLVKKDVQLELAPGTQFYFHDTACMEVEGTLKAKGTLAQPIVFRGDRLDKLLANFPYDYYPGQWGYLRFGPDSYENELEYMDIHGAYYGIIADSSVLDRPKLTMRNSVIHNMVSSCLYCISSAISLGNCQITNSGSYTVVLVGGKSNFTHCTIANYQRLVTRDGPSLVLCNYLRDSEDTTKVTSYPMEAEFNNTIVFGSQSSEIGAMKWESFGWNAAFQNCLLRSGTISPYIATTTDCLYKSDARFLNLTYDNENYRFDFRVDSLSPAIDKGSADYLSTYPTDLNGVSRSTGAKPDIGAYEWISGQK
jgi:hypothetical protein